MNNITNHYKRASGGIRKKWKYTTCVAIIAGYCKANETVEWSVGRGGSGRCSSYI